MPLPSPSVYWSIVYEEAAHCQLFTSPRLVPMEMEGSELKNLCLSLVFKIMSKLTPKETVGLETVFSMTVTRGFKRLKCLKPLHPEPHSVLRLSFLTSGSLS